MEAAAVKPVKTGPTQDEIKRQIELLQAQLIDAPAAPLSPPSRKQNTAKVLAPSTPSPKKRKVHHDHMSKPLVVKRSSTATKKPLPVKQEPAQTAAPTPSTFLSGLGNVNAPGKGEEVVIPRSTAFSQKAVTPLEPAQQLLAPERDDRLALVEDLEPGPYDHKPPFDDPNFEKLEPNSGIHLKTRNLPHEDLQEHLRGRFFLSPSRLYSVIRLSPNKQAYDVPVAGDWVTIAVVAERGPIKITNGGSSRDDEDDEKPSGPNSKKAKADKQPRKPSGKKYMHIKLVDFGHRSRTSSTSKATIKGDAMLSLLLFESDTLDRITGPDGSVKKVYRGGSRGAFEELAKLKEGSVIALLNPKVLRPFQNKSSDTPHPVTNILALTPDSAQSIEIIGMSRDLGMCAVLKRDGKVCGGWCDKRISEVCDYHVQTAVQSRRAARPEFSMGTSGMSTTAAGKRKDYDPARQWGLKPEEKPSTSRETYVLSGHVVSSRGPDYVHEKIGREGQAKAKRKLDQVETERTLQQLLSSNGGQDNAAEAVKRARLAIQANKVRARERNKDKGKGKDLSDTDQSPDNESGEQKRRPYPAEIVKKLGFDPTLKAGQKRLDTKSATSKKLRVSKGDVHLGPPPGPRIRSGVIAPESRMDGVAESFIDRGAQPVDELSDDDLYVAEHTAFGRVVGPTREDSGDAGPVPDGKTDGGDGDSDSELEIEPPP